MRKDYIVSLDLELNKEGDHTTDIIEIGIAIGRIDTREVVAKHNWLVTPKKPLDPFIVNLTGITQESMDVQGLSMECAFHKMCCVLSQYSSYNMPIVWGGGDVEELKAQAFKYSAEGMSLFRMLLGMGLKKNPPPSWPFGRTIMNVKNLTQAIKMSNSIELQGGLAKSMSKTFNIPFNGKKHRAADDAENTLTVFFHILNKLQGVSFK